MTLTPTQEKVEEILKGLQRYLEANALDGANLDDKGMLVNPSFLFEITADFLREKLTSLVDASREEVRREMALNHLDALNDALTDPDLYGCIAGMAEGLRIYLTPPDNT